MSTTKPATRSGATTKRGSKPTATTGASTLAGSGPSTAVRPALAASKSARSEAEITFDRLRQYDKSDGNAEVIGLSGIRQLLTELGINFDSFEMYVLLWRLGAIHKGVVSKAEWLSAAYTYNAEQTPQLKGRLVAWVEEAKDPKADAFTSMYNFLYDYIRGETDRQMSVATAASAWPTLLQSRKPELVREWISWLAESYNRPVSRDLWRQVWVCFSTTEASAILNGTAEVNSKWPTAIEDFILSRKG